MFKTKAVFVAVALTAAASAALADQPGRGFTADFSQCTEFAGVGPVDFARASAVVPAGFSALPVGATGGIVVRATSCAGVSVNGGKATPTTISQIGVEIVPPDGTGDINNYTLIYLSNNEELVDAFNKAGVPARFDATLTYQFTYDSTGKAGELYLAAEAPGVPAYFISGTETDPTGGSTDFKANWWFGGTDVKVKQASDFPAISFGVASVALHTDRNSALGKLIGGNTDGNYSFLPLRGVYSSAHMQVTVSGK